MNWISVKDELPKVDMWLVVYSHVDVVCAGWDNDKHRFFIGCEYLNNVTHWQPLPPPPNKD